MAERENPINGRSERAPNLRAVGRRASESFEERVVWPLQDRFDLLGTAGRILSVVAVLVLVLATAAVGIGLAGSGGSQSEPASQLVAEPAPVVAAAPPKAAQEEESPTLEGAAPVFKPAKGKKSSKGKGDSVESSQAKEATAAPASASGSAATDTISSSPPASSSSASSSSAGATTSSSVDGPPAGAKALAVARDFAGAFVVYETGGDKSEVRKAFAKTATKELTQSLLRRPPRLPANVDVPKAKVVNVVAGPSHDGVFPVSVSLLRLGLTSELRLEMELLNGKRWRVTNVLG